MYNQKTYHVKCYDRFTNCFNNISFFLFWDHCRRTSQIVEFVLFYHNITYKICKYLIKQTSMKSEDPTLFWGCIHLFKIKIVGLCIALTTWSANRSVDILLQGQLWMHFINEKDLSVFTLKWSTVFWEGLGFSGKM